MTRLIRSFRFMGAIAMLAALTPALAQAQAVITGRVVSEAGQPLAGANVFINELNISVGTTPTGNYTISIPAARVAGQAVVLRARAIGFQPATRQITVTSGTQTINFELRRDVTQLTEVVVTGVTAATEQIKVPFTVTRVDTSMMPVTGTSAVSQLQGKIPGAMIMSSSGRPGAAPEVILRGPTSLNSTGRTQQPLYLLDGVPLQGALPDINPNDIESVEVVKGAAAASLYGARAGAGVINITTKTGRTAPQGIRFGFRTEAGASDIEGEFPLNQYSPLALNPTAQTFCSRDMVGGSPCGRYIDWDAEVQRINNSGEDFALPPLLFLRDAGIGAAPSYDMMTGFFQATPWPIMRDPVAQAVTANNFMNSNLDMRGRANNTGVYASVGYLTQQGAVTFLPGFTRHSGRVNVDQRFTDRITANVNTFYSGSVDHAAQFDQTSGTAGTWFVLSRAPYMSDLLARDNLGRIVIRQNPLTQAAQNHNPLYSTAYNRRADRNSRFIGGATLNYQPMDWVTFDANFGYDRIQTQYTQMRDRGWRTTSADPTTSSGFLGQGSDDDEAWTGSIAGTIQRALTTDLQSTFTARYVYSDQTLRRQDLGGINLVVAGLGTPDAIQDNFYISLRPALRQIRDMGFFVGADFDYLDRYIIGGLVRRDGSSLFGAGNRWHTFGRGSVAWIASREPWWPLADQLSLAKLRYSVGTTGQRPRFEAQYETFTIGAGGTLNPAFLGNRDLAPEINRETEVGADLEFFGRYGLNVSYANAVIDGQILPDRAPTASGFSQQWRNAGEITNKTWEATLNVPIVTRGAFNWTSRLIWDQTRSTVTRLDVPDFVGTIFPGPVNTFDVFRFREGERLGTVYGFDWVLRCDQLPAGFNNQCSMNPGDLNAEFRPNSQGFIAWFGAGNQVTEGITRNLWRSTLGGRLVPGDGPWTMRTNWGMPIVLRDSLNNVELVPLGSGIPKYHWGLSSNLDWNRFNFYGLLDANVGNKAWNVAYHWSLGDLQVREIDQFGVSVEEARPLGYYWRRGPSIAPGGFAGTGGLYDALFPASHTFEDAGYVKLRELSASYRLGQLGRAGDWKVGVVGRNLKTWTNFRGFDPEQGNTTGPLNSSILTPIIGYRFPNLRTYTVQLSASF